jgi:hypothetical protein
MTNILGQELHAKFWLEDILEQTTFMVVTSEKNIKWVLKNKFLEQVSSTS